MAIAYFDCFAGASGDMIVAALLDAGADFSALKTELDKLDLDECVLRSETVRRGGLAGTRFLVDLSPAPANRDHDAHRNLNDILGILDRSALSPRITERARGIFTRLGHAEAKVHEIDLQAVHFHEIGAADSIMDIAGACIALELLEVDRVFCSPIPVGSGTFESAHGVLPLPAPATAELLTGATTTPGTNRGELTTPTAAAVLTTLTDRYGAIPPMKVSAVGYGAGTRDLGPVPNLLRVFIGEESKAGETDTIVELSANLDDCTGEVLGAAIERLLSSGCVDAWATPIYMKKSRPGWMISALCAESDASRAEQILFEETTTFGVRRRTMERSKLLREYKTVETPYGPIRIKLARTESRELTASPEFADCQTAAAAHHVPIREVLIAAQVAWRGENRK